MATLALFGLTAIALEQVIAAPLATRDLADWVTRAIKVDRPEGARSSVARRRQGQALKPAIRRRPEKVEANHYNNELWND